MIDWSTLDVPAAITNGLLISIYIKLHAINDKMGKK